MTSNNLFHKLFWNYIYSGKEWNPEQSRQVSFINSFSAIGIFCTLAFGVYRILSGETSGWTEVAFSILGILNAWYLRRSFNAERASKNLLFLMIGIISFLFMDAGIAGTGLYWTFTFPVLAFFLFDDKTGLWWSMSLVAVLMFIWIAHILGFVAVPYEGVVVRQVLFSFLAVVSILYFYTKFSGINARILAERTEKMEVVFNEKKEQTEAWAHGVQRVLKEKLDNFFEIAGDLMCLASKEGYFIETNPAFTKSLGYSPEELLKTPVIEFIHPDDRERTAQALMKVNRGEAIENFTNRYRKKDGTYTWFMWNATNRDGTIYAIAHPVGSLMEAHEKLQVKLVELEKLNRLMVGREVVMAEMKKELAALKGESLNKH